jgi:hypothetical protein
MTEPVYITGAESAVEILWAHALTDRGKVKWIGDQCGRLHSPTGDVIGSFYRDVHHGGWSVWTTPYAGYAYREELEVRPCPEGERCAFADTHFPVTT